ncbi:MAG: rhodanese family protein [Neisseriaceae bacterium]|nr:rhodanese family protein [Neisseriaceae bacterium]
MAIKTIDAKQADELIKSGAVIIDIRSQDEYVRKHIDGAICIPVSEMNAEKIPANSTIIFSCLSGMRTQSNAETLSKCACNCSNVYILEGGMNAWEKCGLPIEKNAACSLDVMRQVQIAAGSLILIGVLLGFFVSKWFFLLSGFVGAGLLFAGLTGFCGMAVLLMKMPWNKV